MRYLLGDSTDSDLQFNYLTFLREVIDAGVVLLEAERTLGTNAERRQTRASESAGMIRAVEELGKDAEAVVDPIMKEQPKTPAGRCAAAIAKAIKEAVDAETSQAKSALGSSTGEIDREDQEVRTRASAVLEKLLRAHDLPNAEKELEAAWATGGVKARMRQRSSFGVEATLVLDASGSAVLAADLRVDRIAENVEIHSHEAGGWLKKGDKLVAQKLGRYQVIGVKVDAKQVSIQLRPPDASGTPLDITVLRNGDVGIAGGAAGKEYAVEDRDRAGLKGLADKLEAALRELEDKRSSLAELVIDGKPFAEFGKPRVIAERLVAAIAPTVQKIAQHSRSPGELVLRRQISDDRREEVFVPVAELVKKIDTLPIPARAVFAPLELGTSLSTGPVARVPAPPVLPADEAKLSAAIEARLADPET